MLHARSDQTATFKIIEGSSIMPGLQGSSGYGIFNS